MTKLHKSNEKWHPGLPPGDDYTVDISGLRGLPASEHQLHRKLVDANGLLDALFDEASRPSLRWLRQMQAQRKIPYRKISHLVRFYVEEVRQALEANCTIHPRKRGR